MTKYSQVVRQAQFDSVSGLFGKTCWVAWVLDIKHTERYTEGHLWWKRERVETHWDTDVNYRMREVAVEKTDSEITIKAEDNFCVSFAGRLVGAKIWVSKDDEEPAITGPIHANTTQIAPGCTLWLHDIKLYK